MCVVGIYELKNNLSYYLHKLEKEEIKEIIITNYGKAVAKIVPFNSSKKGIAFGTAKKYLKNKPVGNPMLGDNEIAKDFEKSI